VTRVLAPDDQLRSILTEAAYGRPLVASGELTVLPTPTSGIAAVVGLPGHHVIAATVDEAVVRSRLRPGDLSQPMSAGFLLYLAGWIGAEPGVLDAVLVATDDLMTDLELWRRDDLGDHPRVQRAARYRTELAVYGDRADGPSDGVVVIGRGLAGRFEMAFEVEPHAQGRGLGRRLATTARSLAPPRRDRRLTTTPPAGPWTGPRPPSLHCSPARPPDAQPIGPLRRRPHTCDRLTGAWSQGTEGSCARLRPSRSLRRAPASFSSS